MGKTLRKFEEGVEAWMRRFGVSALQGTLGVVYLWFGGLRIFGRIPSAAVLRVGLPQLGSPILTDLLGAGEIAIGLGLLLPLLPLRKRLEDFLVRIALLLLFGEIVGTFAAALLAPIAFFAPAFPSLSVLGEFFVRNFVFAAAAMVIAGHIRVRDEEAAR